MHIALRPIALVVGLTAWPLAVVAHFKLLEPVEWVKTSDLGDPQKAGPCGLPDTNGDNAKFLTDASTKVTGGSKLHLKIQETTSLPIRSSPRGGPRKVRTRRGRRFRAHRRFRRLLTAYSRTMRKRVNPHRSVSIRSRL